MTVSQSNNKWRYIYIGLYTIGGIFSFLTLCLLAWIAYCIAMEAEPLAAISFLPPMPTAAVFLLVLGIMLISIIAWQLGAKCQGQYEQHLK